MPTFLFSFELIFRIELFHDSSEYVKYHHTWPLQRLRWYYNFRMRFRILNFVLNNQNNLCSCIYKTSRLVKRKVVSVLLTSPRLFAWISLKVRFQIQRRYLSISDFSCYSVRRNCNKKLKAALKLFFFSWI